METKHVKQRFDVTKLSNFWGLGMPKDTFLKFLWYYLEGINYVSSNPILRIVKCSIPKWVVSELNLVLNTLKSTALISTSVR